MSVVKTTFQVVGSILVVGSGWMAIQSFRGIPEKATAATPAVSDPPRCAALLVDDTSGRADEDEVQRQLPLSRYLQFPAEDRSLLQRADIESVHANGGGPEGMRASNRWHCIALQLQRRGWCRGGGTMSAEDHWLRCSDVPGNPRLRARLPFSEAEMRIPPNPTALDVGFANVGRLFSDNDADESPADHAVTRMRQEGEARFSACASDACRQAVEADLLNRLDFAQGLSSIPIPGIPWRTGNFRLESEGISGGLRLLPVAGQHILVSAATLEAGQSHGICENVIAEGDLGADGVARMTTLDEHGLSFTLHSTESGGIELRPLAEEGEGYARLCGAGGTIFGRYRAMPAR